ncbi:MAG: hypothetical protein F4Z75_04075, partial [Synechococcus sp. SB0668_bin_15]|nr:hypothetical protein [Synechococcus sp. SB0668_bin_15]
MGRPSFLPQLLAASAVAGSLFLLPAGVAEAQGNDSQWRPGESLSSLVGGTLLGGAVGGVVASWLFLRFDLKFNNQISAVDDNINDLKENLDEKTHDLTDKIDNNLTELNQTLSKDFKELKVKGEDNINRLNS